MDVKNTVIKEWIKRGIEKGAMYMLLFEDAYMKDLYPVYVMPEESLEEIKKICSENRLMILSEINLTAYKSLKYSAKHL